MGWWWVLYVGMVIFSLVLSSGQHSTDAFVHFTLLILFRWRFLNSSVLEPSPGAIAWCDSTLNQTVGPATELFFQTQPNRSLTRMKFRSSSNTFTQKVRIAIFFFSFSRVLRIKISIFLRYSLVEDWLAVSTVRSPKGVAIFLLFFKVGPKALISIVLPLTQASRKLHRTKVSGLKGCAFRKLGSFSGGRSSENN